MKGVTPNSAGKQRRCAPTAARIIASMTLLATSSALAQSAGIFDSASLSTTDGQQIYQRICQGCHQSDARGAIGAGTFPALAENPNLAAPSYVALTILNGRRNMPAFGAGHAIAFAGAPVTLSALQIAAVINFVRTHFGNHYRDSITPAEVVKLEGRGSQATP